MKHDPAHPEYIDPSGTRYESSNASIWTKPLGKKVLIVDIDTRVPTDKNQILNPALMDWEKLEMQGGGLVSNAILNHYLYAMIHGYDYKFYQAQHMEDLHDTWIMPHVFRELLPNYQFVVAMDADVTLPHLEVPLEWMFNRWGIQRHSSIAMPWDAEEFHDGESISRDSKGLRVLNTGFVVAQNSATTLALLEAWRDCPSERRYAGCNRWAYEWSHEQRAFSEYIRYDFNHTAETIVGIPCDDAMGWPGYQQDTAAYNPGGMVCCTFSPFPLSPISPSRAGLTERNMIERLQRPLCAPLYPRQRPGQGSEQPQRHAGAHRRIAKGLAQAAGTSLAQGASKPQGTRINVWSKRIMASIDSFFFFSSFFLLLFLPDPDILQRHRRCPHPRHSATIASYVFNQQQYSPSVPPT